MLDVTSSDHKPGFVDLAGQAIRSPAVKPTAGDPVPTPLCTASTPYMRREVVIWGDCVKLRCVAAIHVFVWLWARVAVAVCAVLMPVLLCRYGKTPRDSPWLWSHMRTYVEAMARLFHAFRLDNAHGTPLHVAAYMVDRARAVRPQLYVCAELFTGDVGHDVRYVTKLGINGLVREAMQVGALSTRVLCGGLPWRRCRVDVSALHYRLWTPPI